MPKKSHSKTWEEEQHDYRPHLDWQLAFVIDPDGHNIEAVCHQPDA
jgi:hypothetical protein